MGPCICAGRNCRHQAATWALRSVQQVVALKLSATARRARIHAMPYFSKRHFRNEAGSSPRAVSEGSPNIRQDAPPRNVLGSVRESTINRGGCPQAEGKPCGQCRIAAGRELLVPINNRQTNVDADDGPRSGRRMTLELGGFWRSSRGVKRSGTPLLGSAR